MGENSGNQKLTLWSLICCFSAYSCSITCTPNGAIIGESTTFSEGLAAQILGFFLCSATCALVCLVTYKMGATKDIVFRTLFGKKGFIVASLFFAFCQNFWASYDIFNAGQGVYNLMPEGSGLKNFGFCVGVCIILVLTVIGGVKGITGVKIISNITIPIALALFVAIFIANVNAVGGLDVLTGFEPEGESIGVLGGAQIMYGMWLAGYIGCSDLSVPAKSAKHVIIASICFGAMIFCVFIIGQVGFIGTGFKTVGDICLHLGGAIFVIGNLFVVVAQCNTQPACNYMYSLSYAEIFKTKRTGWAIIMPCCAGILAFIIMYGTGVDFINRITNTVSTLMGPINGVMIGEFFLVRKAKAQILEENEIPNANWTAVFVMVGGAVLCWIVSNFTAFPIPALLIVVLTCVAQWFFRGVLKTR